MRLIIGAVLVAICAGAGPATRAYPDTLSREAWRLDGLKAAEMNRVRAIVRDPGATEPQRMVALFRIADLRMPESVQFLERLYDDLPTAAGAKPGAVIGPWTKRELMEWLAQTGIPEAVPQLTIASWDPAPSPDHRWIAAKGLADIQGVKAIPRLREMLKDKDQEVRRLVRGQLARLGDEEIVRQLIAELGDADEAKARQALFDLSSSDFPQVRDALHRLFVSTPANQGRRKLELKLLAGDPSLRMGNGHSIPEMIELAGMSRKDLRDLQVIRTPAESLEMCTNQNFGTDVEAWRRWWKENGEDSQPFRSPDPRESLPIERAVLEWARDARSGPLIKELPIYVERAGHDRALESASVRLYTPTEIELLGKQCYYLSILSSNGTVANAWLSTLMAKGLNRAMKLHKEGGRWVVDSSSPIHGID